MNGEYTVKLTVGETTIEVTGDRVGVVEIVRGVIDAVQTRPRLALPSPEATVATSVAETATSPDAVSVEPEGEAPTRPSRPVDARTFFQTAKPSTNVEAAVVAAYYVSQLASDDDASQVLNRALFEEVLRKARWRLPPRPDQVLVDAHGAGYLDRAGRGQYKLNNTGHNLVVHTLAVDRA